LKIKSLGLAWGLHFPRQWGRRAEDPFRGLRAGPVRSSPLFLFLPVFGLEFSRKRFTPYKNTKKLDRSRVSG
jgi:hypothetical protein